MIMENKGGKHTMRYRVITLCGSTKFKEEFLEVAKKLTLEGNVVLFPAVYSNSHYPNRTRLDSSTLDTLHNIHLSKIDMSDEIFVINVGGHIGKGTKTEIGYAERNGKIVKYLEDINPREEEVK